MYIPRGQASGFGATDTYSASLPTGALFSAAGWKPTRIAVGELEPVAERRLSSAWDGKGGRHCPSYVSGGIRAKAIGPNVFPTCSLTS